MNPWLSRATEKLHFAKLALESAAGADGNGLRAARVQRAMLEEAAVLHAWGSWLAMLNAIAVHLNLPALEDPSARQLLAEAETRSANAEPLEEIRVLRGQPASWLNRLECKARATWNLRAREPVSSPQGAGLIASAVGGDAPAEGELAEIIAACGDFLERHKNAMEEW